MADWHNAITLLCRANKLPEPVAEYKFHATRRWRFDFAWPEPWLKVALEIEGGVWIRGRHARGKGYEADAIKYSEAAIRGWCVIRVTTGMLADGRAFDLIERALRSRIDAKAA